MASFIFWTGYIVHDGVVKHRQAKQRKKNYQRWESLRDEYDDMKRTPLEGASGEVQRQDGYQSAPADRALFTPRDQQEANDARFSWRPQETWDRPEAGPRSSTQLSRAPSALQPQRTGAWDEAIPERMKVSRRTGDEDSRSWNHASTESVRQAPSSARFSRDYGRSVSGSSRRSPSADSETARRKEEEVEVVESPFDWWKQ